ncbi:MAG: hypothetical protein K2Q32_04800 [Alphaproteobacteria bacterium]|nr:hypothetical protein [Alphaproteobacteria bacterium]
MVSPALADEPNLQANRTFTEAMQLIRKAGATYDTREAVRLLRGADKSLKKIVTDFPESTIAVQLITNQFIGDFDIMDFRNRIRSLSCERGSYVEDFLGEHGIATATGSTTDACFLYRIETLLPALEHPITTARWDWLSLGVSYHLLGQPDRARDIILPFLNALMTKSKVSDNQESLMLLARAMMLINEKDQSQKISQRISDCSAKLYNLMDMTKQAVWSANSVAAHQYADQARDYVDDNQCSWQKSIVAQALKMTDRENDGKKLYDSIEGDQFTNVKTENRDESTPPELAVAAAAMGEPETALNILRVVMEQNPWTISAVVEELGKRGEFDVTEAFINDLKGLDQKAEALATLVETAVKRNDPKRASAIMAKLNALRASPSVPDQQALILAMRARAEKDLYKDERWRDTMQTALNTADLVEESKRSQVALPLIATLAYIKTGNPLLD